jgi:CheY-like chemotaxis protein
VAAYLLKPIKQSELFDAVVMALGVTEVEEEVPATPPAERPRLRRLRILLAEDSLVNQKLAVGLLEKHGHQVVVANHGREAIAAWESGEFDALLMDVQMPEMDGFEATAVIRAKESGTGNHVPIIAMTAHAMKGDRERCLQAGMDAYVAKPIRAGQLFEALETTLPECRQEQPLPEATAAAEEIVDWPQALEGVEGDRRLLRDMVEAFLEEAPRLMAAIREAIAGADAGALQAAVHTLKAPTRCLGATPAFEQVVRLEQVARTKNMESAEAIFAALERQMERLNPVLKEYAAGKLE